MPSRPIHIAVQSDENYIDGLVATLSGVMSRLPRTTTVETFVIDCGITPASREAISSALGSRFPNLTLRYVPIDAEALARLPFPEGLQHANRSTYARLFIPELLSQLDRVIYLDVDLVVDADVTELAELPFEGALVAAAIDVNVPTLSMNIPSMPHRLKPRELDSPGYNGGVMVMDLKAMRSWEFTRQALDLIAQGHNIYGDQTALNALLEGKWKQLDQRWNRQVFLITDFNLFRTSANTIWHFYMRAKPWHFYRDGARGLISDYYGLLDLVGWQPRSTPKLRTKTSFVRDLVKATRAFITRLF